MSTNVELPKTLPRKKQLCKLCREIVNPNDKIVYEERTYHKLCLNELNANKSETDLDNQSIVKIKINDEDVQSINDETSDKFITCYEIVNDNLSLKSLNETIEEIDLNEKNDIELLNNEYQNNDKVNNDDNNDELNNENSNNQVNNEDNNEVDNNNDKQSNLTIDDNQLKSVSSNLSSLNPFGSDEDDDEFYEIESTIKQDKQQINDDKKSYPKDLNPFGDEDEDEIEEIKKEELSTNPFGSDDEKPEIQSYPKDLNPFGEDDDEEKIESIDKQKSNQIPKNYSTSTLECYNNSKQAKTNQFKSSSNLVQHQNYDTLSVRSLTPDSKWKSNKKRQAPRPPSFNNQLITNPSSSNTSLNSNNRNDNDTISTASLTETEKSFVSLNESKENISSSVNQPQQKRRFKNKKAPPTPGALLKFVGSIEEIENECDMIGDKLLVNHNSIRDIELKLKDNCIKKENLTKGQIKKLIFEYFNLVETKCLLAKRQEELMYLKCQNKLERDQLETDSNLRSLLKKEAKLKTFEDLRMEEDLLGKLVDIIERKNEIEENIIRIDKIDEFNKSVQKIKQFVDETIYNYLLNDFQKNYLNSFHLKNNHELTDNHEEIKKKKKSKGFTLKKLSKLKLSTN